MSAALFLYVGLLHFVGRLLMSRRDLIVAIMFLSDIADPEDLHSLSYSALKKRYYRLKVDRILRLNGRVPGLRTEWQSPVPELPPAAFRSIPGPSFNPDPSPA